ncbi:MAG TPA: hypothetical protein VM598_11125 [Bdellovibrionota bacterium]|nr:hypothetical protein [Bdellovibrionota bacterium]
MFGLGLALAPSDARAMSCFEYANEHGPFTYFQAQRLCAGSTSFAPAQCGIAAYPMFPTEHVVRLCNLAPSTAPVLCAVQANRGIFNSIQIATLCNQAQVSAPAECALAGASYRVWTTHQLIELCYGAVDLYPIQCAVSEYNRTRQIRSAVDTCRAIPAPVSDPLPFPGPGPGPGPGPIRPDPGGGGTGMFTTCVMATGTGSYQGIGFTEGQATAAARDQCLQVESVLACNAGRVTCR